MRAVPEAFIRLEPAAAQPPVDMLACVVSKRLTPNSARPMSRMSVNRVRIIRRCILFLLCRFIGALIPGIRGDRFRGPAPPLGLIGSHRVVDCLKTTVVGARQLVRGRRAGSP